MPHKVHELEQSRQAFYYHDYFSPARGNFDQEI